MTKNLVPLFILIIASFVITSCNKLKDIVFFDTPLAIDSVQLVDYPNIKLKITQNAEGLLLQNNSILPHIDSTKNLKLKFYCKNLKLISSPEIILAPLTNLVDNGKDPEHESLEDSFKDMANYAIIGLLVLRGEWDVA